MNGYALGLYEKALPPELTLKEKLLLTRECGFDHLELSVDESAAKLARLELSRDVIRSMAEDIFDSGVPVRTMCLSGHRKYPLGSPDPAIRVQGMQIMERAIQLAVELGIRIIQLAGYDVYYAPGNDETARLFSDNLGTAVEMAAKHGILLGFETMETPFMDTVEKAMRYVHAINSPYLGVYPDIGNLKNAAVLYGNSVTQDLLTGRGHIFAAHLKETRPGIYRDMDFGTGHTEYVPCIAELLRQGVGMFTAECWYHGEQDINKKLQHASDYLRSQFQFAMNASLSL